MRNRPGVQAARAGPARPSALPAMHTQQDQRPGHDGHPDDDHQTSLDVYVARLVAAAPPLSSQQRDTLALLLRHPRPR
jgi:beta-phosphoglucomutase-like phosphatase (HAD superfamily)